MAAAGDVPSERSIVIRPASPSDADAMADVHARSWRATYAGLLPDALIDAVLAARTARVERWRGSLASTDPSRGCFVAQHDGRVVGFVFWGPASGDGAGPEAGEVYAIYLDPAVIGQGFGRALLGSAVDALAACGYGRAVLWVLDTNDRARRFYEAAGWRPDGATKSEDRPGGRLDEVRYARAIAPTIVPRDSAGGAATGR